MSECFNLDPALGACHLCAVAWPSKQGHPCAMNEGACARVRHAHPAAKAREHNTRGRGARMTQALCLRRIAAEAKVKGVRLLKAYRATMRGAGSGALRRLTRALVPAAVKGFREASLRKTALLLGKSQCPTKPRPGKVRLAPGKHSSKNRRGSARACPALCRPKSRMEAFKNKTARRSRATA